MAKYDHKKIEKKWQARWEKEKLYKAVEDARVSKDKRFYILSMFPYPSAAGLHVGHPTSYTAVDIQARCLRMKGFNVLNPMGWDAFGLPAENYALKTGRHPRITTAENIKKMKKQIQGFGFSYDWSREMNTTNPEYYKWTQRIFLKMFEAGLAYESVVPINWCPSCKTGLANEEVVDDKCERCGMIVTKKDMKQWLLKITDYAERLLSDLKELDWPEKIKEMQKNWIGRSEGVEINFKGLEARGIFKNGLSEVKAQEYDIPVFTTRVDTIFGVTALVLAPEHPLVGKLTSDEERPKVEKYLKKIKEKSEIERTSEESEIEGVPLGAGAVNPLTGEKIPIWIADYVLLGYGTGAVMCVPAHDARDFKFAKKYGLDIKWVIAPPHEEAKIDGAYEGEGFLVNSGEFSGITSQDARIKLADYLENKGLGRRQVQYHLRDWVFSRQRYWGEPIPLIFCNNCKKLAENSKLKTQNSKLKEKFSKGELVNPGWIPLKEKDLPLKLPDVKKYEPTGTGKSPLANIKNWVKTKCPQCGGPAERETNTMPQWAGSCWYWLRYTDPKNKKEFASKEKINYWLSDKGVNLYIGGSEHAVLHLLYARFWHKFLYDEGLLNHKEPFRALRNQGLILASDGQKMSKSRGNAVNPDEIIEKYGADAMRIYLMFMGPFEDAKIWSDEGIVGAFRFLERVWLLKNKVDGKDEKDFDLDLLKLIHQTIKKVSEDIDGFKFNTAISALMILTRAMQEKSVIPRTQYKILLQLLSPFAPHIGEELWQMCGEKKSIFKSEWPAYDSGLAQISRIELIIQVNGKMRDKIEVPADIKEEQAKSVALSSLKVKKYLAGKEIKKVIFVKGKLINIVV